MDTLEYVDALENGQSLFTRISAPVFDFLSYLQRNAWSIVFLIAIGFYLKANVIGPFLEERRRKANYRAATDPKRVSALQTDMRRIRAAQQAEARERAMEAEEKKEKEGKSKLAELERKRVPTPMEMRAGQGRRLDEDSKKKKSDAEENKKVSGGRSSSSRGTMSRRGGGGSSGGGYNALNPSSGHSSGYRATRRNPRRS